MFVINCKNYEEIAGDKITKFIKTVEKVSKKYKIKIAVAPPQHLVGAVSKSSPFGVVRTSPCGQYQLRRHLRRRSSG